MPAPFLIQNNGNDLPFRKYWIVHSNFNNTFCLNCTATEDTLYLNWEKKEVGNERALVTLFDGLPSATVFYCCQFSESNVFATYICLLQEVDIQILIKLCCNDSCYLHELGNPCKKLP